VAELNVECKKCRADLEAEWRTSKVGDIYLAVESCGRCLDARGGTAYQTGYDDGKVASRDEAEA